MTKKLVCIMAIISMITANGFIPTVNAASLTQAKDTLSDSDIGVSSNHTLTFTNNAVLANGDYFQVVLPGDFGTFNDTQVACPGTMTVTQPAARTARCTSVGATATGTKTIIISGVTNPGAVGSQIINIASYSGATLIEYVDVVVAIVNHVTLYANVPSTLAFSIIPLATSTTVNGQDTTITSATSTLQFGILSVGTSSIMGQELRVTTNANDGYSVTVEQDQNLTSNGNADIDSFRNGTTTNPQGWANPDTVLDEEWTYGHFGFTSDDSTLTAGDYYGDNLWRGFSSSTPVEVLRHTGPSDGQTQDKGLAKVAYRIQISALQEAGDYTNVLTYIATPTY